MEQRWTTVGWGEPTNRHDSTTYFTRCSCGLLNNERTPNGNRYYYLFDGLGSVVGMTSDSGNKVNSYDYDPYGVMLNQVEKTGVDNPFKYAGGYLDASGYYLFGVRYYDPSLGRWTQQDPVAGSLFDLNSGNRYTYVEDDPVNLVDPSGKAGCATGIIVALLGSILAVVSGIPSISGLIDFLIPLIFAGIVSLPLALTLIFGLAGILVLFVLGSLLIAIANCFNVPLP